MTLNGVITADPRYLCSSWESCSLLSVLLKLRPCGSIFFTRISFFWLRIMKFVKALQRRYSSHDACCIALLNGKSWRRAAGTVGGWSPVMAAMSCPMSRKNAASVSCMLYHVYLMRWCNRQWWWLTESEAVNSASVKLGTTAFSEWMNERRVLGVG